MLHLVSTFDLKYFIFYYKNKFILCLNTKTIKVRIYESCDLIH